MRDDFHLIDLASQAPAVQRLLAGLPVERKLEWLAARGELVRISNRGPDLPAWHRFESTVGLEHCFFFDGDTIVFMGDHSTFIVTDDGVQA